MLLSRDRPRTNLKLCYSTMLSCALIRWFHRYHEQTIPRAAKVPPPPHRVLVPGRTGHRRTGRGGGSITRWVVALAGPHICVSLPACVTKPARRALRSLGDCFTIQFIGERSALRSSNTERKLALWNQLSLFRRACLWGFQSALLYRTKLGLFGLPVAPRREKWSIRAGTFFWTGLHFAWARKPG